MRKHLLILSLLLSTTTFSSLSFGEWQVLFETESTVYYWDPENIKKNDGLIYNWQILDYKEQRRDRYRSAMIYFEINCITSAVKNLSQSFYMESMAKGLPNETVSQENPRANYSPPNTPQYFMDKKVCDYASNN